MQTWVRNREKEEKGWKCSKARKMVKAGRKVGKLWKTEVEKWRKLGKEEGNSTNEEKRVKTRGGRQKRGNMGQTQTVTVVGAGRAGISQNGAYKSTEKWGENHGKVR